MKNENYLERERAESVAHENTNDAFAERLQQAIFSGQVSAAQIEAHHEAGELPDRKPKIKMKLSRERFGKPAGTEVFKCQEYDYGLARDDTNMTGVDHISVSLNPDGDYPLFTVSEADIERTGHAKELPITMHEPRFQHTYCSQCLKNCGPGDDGVASCADHAKWPIAREVHIALRDGERIGSEDAYFKARPQLDTIEQRNVFNAGFDRGFDAGKELGCHPIVGRL